MFRENSYWRKVELRQNNKKKWYAYVATEREAEQWLNFTMLKVIDVYANRTGKILADIYPAYLLILEDRNT